MNIEALCLKYFDTCGLVFVGVDNGPSAALYDAFWPVFLLRRGLRQGKALPAPKYRHLMTYYDNRFARHGLALLPREHKTEAEEVVRRPGHGLARGGEAPGADRAGNLLAEAEGGLRGLEVVDEVVHGDHEDTAQEGHDERGLAIFLLHRGLEAEVKAAWDARLDDAVRSMKKKTVYARVLAAELR